MKIAALISGGVDSSVALSLLAASGEHEITAYYLKIWLEDELAFLGECPWEEDLKYASAVCERWNIPLHVIPLQAEYLERVVSYTISELRLGHTPSPDIFCNQRIKFGAFLDRIGDSFDRVMSGHYAIIKRDVSGVAHLHRSIDPVKDQTYFLSHLSPTQLSKCLFPLGDIPKAKVRELAESYDLLNKNRPDSQGICFLGKISFRDFVRHHLGSKVGNIIDQKTGKILGQHEGYWFHTIGQRKGLNLSGGPWFVSGKDVDQNIIYVHHADHQVLNERSEFHIRDVHWLSGPPRSNAALTCKIRHGERRYECFYSADDSLVKLSEADAGIAAGQFCVFYADTECLGGGMIC